jgi:hypothetical protein
MTAEVLAATEHLVLRRMTNDDAAALAAYRSDPVQARSPARTVAIDWGFFGIAPIGSDLTARHIPNAALWAATWGIEASLWRDPTLSLPVGAAITVGRPDFGCEQFGLDTGAKAAAINQRKLFQTAMAMCRSADRHLRVHAA